MRMQKLTLIVGVTVFACLAFCAYADTLDDIKTNVRANHLAVQDMTAVLNTEQSAYPNIVDANYKAAGMTKFRFDGTGIDVRKIRTNGIAVWYDYDGQGWNTSAYATWINDKDTDYKNSNEIFDFSGMIDDNTWTLVGTESVSGINCYKISSSAFDMWVDTATKTKVIKVVNKNEVNEYAIITSWTFVEGTAYVPTAVSYYYGTTTRTTTLSSVSINDSLPDSTWTIL